MRWIWFGIAMFVSGWLHANSCAATPKNCTEFCSVYGHDVDCYEDNDWAECTAFDVNGSIVDHVEVTCGGGSGTGGGGGTGGGSSDCAIYWWLCDPWAI